MFVFGKLVHFLIHPIHLILVLVGVGLVLRLVGWRRPGSATLWAAGGFVAVVSLTPIGSALAFAIENRIQAADYDLLAVQGVIVLGGSTGHPELVASHGTYMLNDGAERLTTLVALRRRRPDLPAIVSGGQGRLIPHEINEAAITRQFLEDMGVDPSTVEFEDRSRNTYENAIHTKEMLSGREGPWLLVTSAHHMPRALGCFRRAGIEVIPVPVDYRIGPPSWGMLSPHYRFGDLDLAISEIVGLVTYRLLGRTDALFPDD
jgi:uncharacterized SAM-binding protein YcdF (DUF218 family)